MRYKEETKGRGVGEARRHAPSVLLDPYELPKPRVGAKTRLRSRKRRLVCTV